MSYDFQVPVEYSSLPYLGLGDVQMVEHICIVWNKVNEGDTLRVKSVVEGCGKIVITGICSDIVKVLSICKWFTSLVVQVVYQPTTITFTI